MDLTEPFCLGQNPYIDNMAFMLASGEGAEQLGIPASARCSTVSVAPVSCCVPGS